MRSLPIALWVGHQLAAGVALAVLGVNYLHDVLAQVGIVLAAVISTSGTLAAARFTYARLNRVDERLSRVDDAAQNAADAAGSARLTTEEIRELRTWLEERRHGQAPDSGQRRRREDPS